MTQTQKKHDETMPRMGFEPTMAVFEKGKAFYALDRSAAVIGDSKFTVVNF
jgi:hypothetical protein